MKTGVRICQNLPKTIQSSLTREDVVTVGLGVVVELTDDSGLLPVLAVQLQGRRYVDKGLAVILRPGGMR